MPGTEICGSGGASLPCVGLPSDSLSVSLETGGERGEVTPISTDLVVDASSPLLLAKNDVSRPPDGTGGYAPGYLYLDPLEGGTELPLFFWDARDADLA